MSKHGQDRNISGHHRDPLDFSGLERELRRRNAPEVPNEPIPVPPVPIDRMMVEGFAYRFLHAHYDRPVAVPDLHREWWDMVLSDHRFVAIAAPRGHAKSTCITLAYGMCMLLSRQASYILIVSDTFEGQAVEFIREYRRELTENKDLIQTFGIRKIIKETEGDLIVQFKDSNMFRVKALGMEGSVRGVKWRGKRPDLIIIDDAENPELVESKLRREKSRKWLMKDLIEAGGKGCKVRMVGTILHYDAALARFLRDDQWLSRTYRAHKSLNDFSEMLWPEAWPVERLMETRQRYLNQNDPTGYAMEYLNDPVPEGEAYFNPTDLVPMDDRDYDVHGDYYLGWDFAVTKDQRNDSCALSVWKVDEHNRKYVVDGFKKRLFADEIIDAMIEYEVLYQPRAHFSEKGTIDNALGPFLDTEMRRRECYMNIVKITRNKDKETFAKPLQGMVRRHDVKFNHKMAVWPDMQEELRKFLKSDHDDVVDALSIVAQGLRELVQAQSLDERDDEDYWHKTRDDAPDGRSQYTGY